MVPQPTPQQVAAHRRTARILVAFIVFVPLVLLTVGLVLFNSSDRPDKGPDLPRCRPSAMVDEDTMMVPVVDDEGFTTGYRAQQCISDFAGRGR